MYSPTVLRIFLDQTSNIDHSSDGNEIMFAPMYKADVDSKCFTSSNEKICEHKVNAVKLDMVGDFVVFPSRFFHYGYYTIASNMTYYMAQLFCKISDNGTAECDKEGQPDHSARMLRRIMVGTTHARHMQQLGYNVLFQCISACKGIRW